MNQYVKTFFGLYLGLLVALIVAVVGLGWEPSSSFGMILVTAAGFGASAKFVNDNKRVPEPDEKKKIVWGCILIVAIVNIVLMAFYFITNPEAQTQFAQMLSKMPWLALIFPIMIVGLPYLILSWAFGWYARTMLKMIHKREEKLRLKS